MAKEIRYLLLSTEEVRDSLIAYHQSISNIRFESGRDLLLSDTLTGASARLTLCSFRSNATKVRDFATSELLAAVLLFCKSRRIPVAQRSHKTMEIFGAQLALLTTILAGPNPVVDDNKISYTDAEIEAGRRRIS
jgi:hypothetical protein